MHFQCLRQKRFDICRRKPRRGNHLSSNLPPQDKGVLPLHHILTTRDTNFTQYYRSLLSVGSKGFEPLYIPVLPLASRAPIAGLNYIMSGIQLDTPLAEALSNVVHAKITESGWSQEDDTSLAEYIVLMLVNGKTRAQIASELQSDLLPDVDGIPEFTKWLLNQVDILRKGNSVDNAKSSHSAQDVGSHPVQVYPTQEVDMPAGGGADEIPAAYDADMGDSAPDNA